MLNVYLINFTFTMLLWIPAFKLNGPPCRDLLYFTDPETCDHSISVALIVIIKFDCFVVKPVVSNTTC